MNEQNPYGFTQELLDLLAKTSGDMYDCFYDFLATFQFDFSLEEKTWLLAIIARDIMAANAEAEQDAIDNI